MLEEEQKKREEIGQINKAGISKCEYEKLRKPGNDGEAKRGKQKKAQGKELVRKQKIKNPERRKEERTWSRASGGQGGAESGEAKGKCKGKNVAKGSLKGIGT